MTYTEEQVLADARSVRGIGYPLIADELEAFGSLLRERESAEPVAWMTHHDAPMLFPTERECAEYCADDERPIPLYTHPKRESAKAAVTDEMVEYASRIYTDASPLAVEAMRAALEAVAPTLASARVPDDYESSQREVMESAARWWKHANNNGVTGAVKWLRDNETGATVIYTRGEYEDRLIAAVCSLEAAPKRGEG